MKKIVISLAVMTAAAVAIVAVNAENRLDEQFEANLEALASIEGIQGKCHNNSNSCMYFCTCGAVWEATTSQKGPSYSVSGTCSKCHKKI